VSFHIKIIKII